MKPLILVPFDFSPAAERALLWATEYLRAVGGGSIQVVHIVDRLPGLMVGMAIPPAPEELAQLQRDLQAAVERLSAGAGWEVLTGVGLGASVVALARERHVDLIVMGTTGRGGLGRMLLGSVADHVVRQAPCPVVTLRALEK